LVKLYKVDTAQWIKDDKTIKPAKAKYLKKGQKKKPQMSQFSETLAGSELGEMNVTIGEDGLPIENEGDMEGMEGMEGMDGENEEDKEGEDKEKEEGGDDEGNEGVDDGENEGDEGD